MYTMSLMNVTYLVNGIASIKTSNKKLQICRSGYRMAGLTKSVSNDAQGKGYQFNIKCSPMASRSCVSISCRY